MPGLMARIAVTLGVLAVYRLGAVLPLAGIDHAALTNLFQANQASPLAAVVRFSVLGLGVTPIISMLVLVEVARLASSRFNDWAGATPANARRVDHYVLIGSLLIAAMQGYGIATALEEMSNFVDEPGPQFRLMVVATLVAATALIVWLASLISRHGLGSGIWVLFLVPHIATLPSFAAGMMELVRQGAMSMAVLLAALACTVIAVAALVALVRPLILSRMPLDRTLIWPLFIAAFLADMLLLAPWLFPAGGIRDAVASLCNPGAPLYLAALGIFVIAISLAQWRAAEAPAVAGLSSPSVERRGASPRVLTALTLAAVAVVPEILRTHFGIPILIGGGLIAATVSVALVAQVLARR
jgi:preprotein translocase subunit SecY